LPVSAVRKATLEIAARAQRKLEAKYAETYRMFPAEGQDRVVAEADGTLLCTVKPGRRKAKRPREWKEMRLLAAQAQGSCQTHYAAAFQSVERAGRRWGHCARDIGSGLNTHTHVVADGAPWIALQSDVVFGDASSDALRLLPRQRVSGCRRQKHLPPPQ
jgi:hypothetical protein